MWWKVVKKKISLISLEEENNNGRIEYEPEKVKPFLFKRLVGNDLKSHINLMYILEAMFDIVCCG